MYEPLVPCPACRRHVRATDHACPFCAGALGDARPVPGTRARLRRSALAVFTSTLVACGGTTTEDPGKDAAADGVSDGKVDVAVDGPSDGLLDTGLLDTGLFDTGIDTGGAAPPYGIPPEDSGFDGGATDSGSPGSDYGAPPPKDAG